MSWTLYYNKIAATTVEVATDSTQIVSGTLASLNSTSILDYFKIKATANYQAYAESYTDIHYSTGMQVIYVKDYTSNTIVSFQDYTVTEQPVVLAGNNYSKNTKLNTKDTIYFPTSNNRERFRAELNPSGFNTNDYLSIGSLYAYTNSITVSRNPTKEINISKIQPNETKTLYNGRKISIPLGAPYSTYEFTFNAIQSDDEWHNVDDLYSAITIMKNEPCLMYIDENNFYHGQIYLDSDISSNLDSQILNNISFTLTEVV
jgi:hypothetical protein